MQLERHIPIAVALAASASESLSALGHSSGAGRCKWLFTRCDSRLGLAVQAHAAQ